MIATSIMAVKATPKALSHLEVAKEEKGDDLTKFEIVKVAGPAYIPAIAMGASTLACIFGANILNKRQQAGMASAYALLDSSYKEYRKKTIELYGEEGDKKIKDEIAKDKYNKADIKQSDPDKTLFYDDYSGRYFESTIEAILYAKYALNRDLHMREYATLNEWYDYIKLPHVDSGDELGWSTGMNFDYYWQTWIDFAHNKVVMDDGRECHKIVMMSEPCLDWYEY